MRRFILLFAFFFASGLSLGQQTILWKVQDTLTHKTSYLLGTHHLFGNTFVDSIPLIKESLLKSELAVFESLLDIDSIRNRINARNVSYEIEKGLKKKDLDYLKELSKNWKVDLYKLKPLELSWKLSGDVVQKICNTIEPTDEWNHFDDYLIHLAKDNNIDAIGLETDSLQWSLIEQYYNNPTWKQERKYIRYMIMQLVSDQPNMYDCVLSNKYRIFDLDYAFQVECDKDILIQQRNENWLRVIPEFLKKKNSFIAVGFAHLQHTCGLVIQLRERGFLVEPVPLEKVGNFKKQSN